MPRTPNPVQALETAVLHAGGKQTQLAEQLTRIGYNCPQSAIATWFKRLSLGKTGASRHACGPIEAATQGQVRAEWLRPDLTFTRNKRGYVVGFGDGRRGRWQPPKHLKSLHHRVSNKGAR